MQRKLNRISPNCRRWASHTACSGLHPVLSCFSQIRLRIGYGTDFVHYLLACEGLLRCRDEEVKSLGLACTMSTRSGCSASSSYKFIQDIGRNEIILEHPARFCVCIDEIGESYVNKSFIICDVTLSCVAVHCVVSDSLLLTALMNIYIDPKENCFSCRAFLGLYAPRLTILTQNNYVIVKSLNLSSTPFPMKTS